jgi:GTPase SAR1 family protein
MSLYSSSSSSNVNGTIGHHEYCCKVVLVGDAGVGKSCFMKKYVEDTYVEDRVVTIGVDHVRR